MKRAIVLLFVLSACKTEFPPPARRVYVAEGARHVIAFRMASVAPEAAPEWYARAMETDVPALRDAPGNVGVYVLQTEQHGHVVMTILSEWKSRDDLERCRQSGPCKDLDDDEEILFEALR